MELRSPCGRGASSLNVTFPNTGPGESQLLRAFKLRSPDDTELDREWITCWQTGQSFGTIRSSIPASACLSRRSPTSTTSSGATGSRETQYPARPADCYAEWFRLAELGAAPVARSRAGGIRVRELADRQWELKAPIRARDQTVRPQRLHRCSPGHRCAGTPRPWAAAPPNGSPNGRAPGRSRAGQAPSARGRTGSLAEASGTRPRRGRTPPRLAKPAGTRPAWASSHSDRSAMCVISCRERAPGRTRWPAPQEA